MFDLFGIPLPVDHTQLNLPGLVQADLPPPTKAVVFFSGGEMSWAAAKRTAKKYGPENVRLLFTDTKIEDEDLYRFLKDAVDNVGSELVYIADGRTVWEVFADVQVLGNSRIDPCSRVLKREPAEKWLKENVNPLETALVFGLDWTEGHRYDDEPDPKDPLQRRRGVKNRYARLGYPFVEAPMMDAPYLDRGGIASWLKLEGIRRAALYEDGFSHNNCFQYNTAFITADGIRKIGDASGENVTILGVNGKWTDAEVKSFGSQQLVKLTLQKYGVVKEILTTSDHRWFVRPGRYENDSGRKECLTKNLKTGQRLASVYGRLGGTVHPSAYGIAQGIVFGDGTRCQTGPFNPPANVVFCGEKADDLLKFFPLSPSLPVPDTGIRVSDLPRFWKDLPNLEESKSFLYGWLAGYFAADGSASSGGIRLKSSNLRNLEFAQTVAIKLGIGTGEIKTESKKGFGSENTDSHTLVFISDTLREDFFLRKKHIEYFKSMLRRKPADWEVVSIEETDRFEEVFCAVVPDGHVFALAGNILTGNCGGGCVKAGKAHFAHLLRVRPLVYAKWEAEEKAFNDARPGKRFQTILRDEIKGQPSRPLSLKALRERLEAGGQIDMFDIGGCGCFVRDDDEFADYLPSPSLELLEAAE